MLLQWVVEIASNPPPRVAWYDPRGELIPEGEDKTRGRVVHTALSIKNTRSMLQVSPHWLARGHVTTLLISDLLQLTGLKLRDAGQYSVKVENDFHVKWENFTLEVTDPPAVTLAVMEPGDGGLYQVIIILFTHLYFQCKYF